MTETVSVLSRKIRDKCKEIRALLGDDPKTKEELNVADLQKPFSSS